MEILQGLQHVQCLCSTRHFVFPILEPVVEKATADKSGKKSSTMTASVTADAEATVEKETESVLTAVIAETSETVVIEGVQDDEVSNLIKLFHFIVAAADTK
jgi:hypothetical protein